MSEQQNDFTITLFNKDRLINYERKSLRKLENIGIGYSARQIMLRGNIHLQSEKDCDKVITLLQKLKPCFKNNE